MYEKRFAWDAVCAAFTARLRNLSPKIFIRRSRKRYPYRNPVSAWSGRGRFASPSSAATAMSRGAYIPASVEQ
jgi:hypothetical protein